MLDLGQRVDCQSKDLLERSSSSLGISPSKSVIIANITIITITKNMIVIILMIRVERQGRDLMERQKEVSKDSSKLGKEEVSSNN